MAFSFTSEAFLCSATCVLTAANCGYRLKLYPSEHPKIDESLAFMDELAMVAWMDHSSIKFINGISTS